MNTNNLNLASGSVWEIIRILPNLSIKDKSPFLHRFIKIVSPTDPEVGTTESDKVRTCWQNLLSSFQDIFGKKYIPAVLAVHKDFYSIFSIEGVKAMEAMEAIRAFRNIAAICTILPVRSKAITTLNVLGPSCADYFDLYPMVPNSSGFIVFRAGAVSGIDNRPGFTGQCSPHIVYGDTTIFSIDDELWNSLIRAWELCYYLKKNINSFRRIFRSLEVAFHALRVPSDQFTSIFDIGTRIALWISALEILAHPITANVNQAEVINFLTSYSWYNRQMKFRRYKSRKKSGHRISFIERLIEDLYEARNDFIHGNPTSGRSLYPFGDIRRRSLNDIAVFIYRAVLILALQKALPSRKIKVPQDNTKFWRWIQTSKGRRWLQEIHLLRYSSSIYEDTILTGLKPSKDRKYY